MTEDIGEGLGSTAFDKQQSEEMEEIKIQR